MCSQFIKTAKQLSLEKVDCSCNTKARYCRIYKIYTSIFLVYSILCINIQQCKVTSIFTKIQNITSKFSVYIVYKYTQSKVTSVFVNIHQYIRSVYSVCINIQQRKVASIFINMQNIHHYMLHA